MNIARLCLAFTAFLLISCTSLVQKSDDKPDPALLAQALAGELILGKPYRASELPDDDLFGLTPEMEQFVAQVVQGAGNQDAKAEAIHRALISPAAAGGRGVTYSAFTTNTGINAFEQRQANCLSYTLMYVALARHAGLNAQYNEVMLPPTWDMRGDNTYLFMRHINARVVMPVWKSGFVRMANQADISDVVVDLEMRRYRPNYKQHSIDKDLVAAQYYSNRGMELASDGQSREAFLYLRKALLMDEEVSYIWSNLGSFYRRQGFNRIAEAVYLQGLSLNDNDYTVMHNLAGLYKEMDNPARQQFYMERVRRHRSANPYYQYKLAQEAYAKADYAKAKNLIEKSIKQEKDEPRFYQLAKEIYEQLGDNGNAEKMSTRLYKLRTNTF